MGVSKNNGTPKSSILIGFSIIHHPFWGTAIFGNIQIGYSLALVSQIIYEVPLWFLKISSPQGCPEIQTPSQRCDEKIPDKLPNWKQVQLVQVCESSTASS